MTKPTTIQRIEFDPDFPAVPKPAQYGPTPHATIPCLRVKFSTEEDICVWTGKEAVDLEERLRAIFPKR